MHVFEMVVLIVLIGGVVSIVTKHMDRKGSGADTLNFGDDGDPLGLGLGGKNSVSLERLEKLEERVAVLEKIITDRNYDLKEEFDRL